MELCVYCGDLGADTTDVYAQPAHTDCLATLQQMSEYQSRDYAEKVAKLKKIQRDQPEKK